MLRRPECDRNTIKKLTVRRPSSEGMCAGETRRPPLSGAGSISSILIRWHPSNRYLPAHGVRVEASERQAVIVINQGAAAGIVLARRKMLVLERYEPWTHCCEWNRLDYLGVVSFSVDLQQIDFVESMTGCDCLERHA